MGTPWVCDRNAYSRDSIPCLLSLKLWVWASSQFTNTSFLWPWHLLVGGDLHSTLCNYQGKTLECCPRLVFLGILPTLPLKAVFYPLVCFVPGIIDSPEVQFTMAWAPWNWKKKPQICQKSLRRIWIPIFSSVNKNDELPRIFLMTKKSWNPELIKIILSKRSPV